MDDGSGTRSILVDKRAGGVQSSAMASSQATSHIHQLLDEHWTATLRVQPSVWRDAEVVVASHPEPSHTDLVYLIRREDSCIIVVPQTLVGSTTTACAAWPSAAVFDRAFVRSLYGAAISSIHGPFWLGYATPDTFRPVDSRGVRVLDGTADEAALATLRAQVGEDEWIDAGFEIPTRQAYGGYAGEELVCAGTLTPFGGAAASVGALTSPAHRNQGLGAAMLSALTVTALERSSVAQCRVLEATRAAVRIARMLGFVEDGRTLEVVLHVPPRGDAFDG
jgi:GNAT superfamily N-acetyltransferase